MAEQPYAYMSWRCSECSSEPLEKDDGTLLCETCGHTFEVDRVNYATLVPEDEDGPDGPELEEAR
jgi:uncharacterized Zn finger protein (UPF0148 family)